MRDLVVLFIHFIATLARLLRPGGVRSIVAESLLLKHQLLILNRSRQPAPNLSASDRILAGWLTLSLRPTRLLRSAIVLKPSTLLGLHQAMCKQKYRMLFSSENPAPAWEQTTRPVCEPHTRVLLVRIVPRTRVRTGLLFAYHPACVV